MRATNLIVLVALLNDACAMRAQIASNTNMRSRRQALKLAVAAGAALGSGVAPTTAAEETVKLYFGAGCFWHVQHEFVGEEMSTLKRSGAQITAVSGYAGGQRLGDGERLAPACCGALASTYENSAPTCPARSHPPGRRQSVLS